MRKAFVETLIDLAANDDRIVLLTADIGYNALEPFVVRFPARFYNVGVAEQNLIALATGLAESGFRPYCYSIANFAVLRPYEFIRNGPVMHQLPVRLVGMGGGLEYGSNGMSHHALEDVGVLRALSGLAIFVPADGKQARTMLEQTVAIPGPIYYRLEKDDTLSVPGLEGRFTAGRPEVLTRGDDILLIGMGGLVTEVVAAAEALRRNGLAVGVAAVSTIAPFDKRAYAELIRDYRTVVTIEAHSVNGGLGSATAEVIAELGVPCRLVRRGVVNGFDGVTGDRAALLRRHGLSAGDIAQVVVGLAREPLASHS